MADMLRCPPWAKRRNSTGLPQRPRRVTGQSRRIVWFSMATRYFRHSFIAKFEPDFLCVRVDDRKVDLAVGCATPWSGTGRRHQRSHEARGKPGVISPIDESGSHEIASIRIGECVENHGYGAGR